jgi:hypothetical protein
MWRFGNGQQKFTGAEALPIFDPYRRIFLPAMRVSFA